MTTAENASRRRPGRPRDPATNRVILEAALGLLSERGFAGLTMDAVAARAAVSKSTIYRRWPSREALVVALAADKVGELPAPDTGRVRDDLVAYIGALTDLWRGPDPDAFREVIGELWRNPLLRGSYRDVIRARRDVTRAMLVRGQERGEIRADADLDVAIDMITGAPAYRLLVTGDPIPGDLCERAVDTLLAGIAGPTATPRAAASPEGLNASAIAGSNCVPAP